MPIYWMRARDAWQDLDWGENRFTAFDPDVRFPAPFPGYAQYRAKEGAEYIGTIDLIESGPQEGQWSWSMTVSLPGPRFGGATNGVEGRRGDAARRVIEAYRAYMATRPKSYER